MNNFIQLSESLNNHSSFEELARLLLRKNIVDQARQVLSEYNILNEIKVQEFLSVFLISCYPHETIGAKEIQKNQELLKMSGYVLYNRSEEHIQHILKYVELFRDWKQQDYQILVNDMFHKYHSLTVDILNAPEESKEHLENCKQEILVQANQIGGQDLVDKILSYSPVIIDTEQLQKQYDKAFWDLFKTEYDDKNYNLLYQLLDEIRNILLTLNPSNTNISEVIDVPFIRQQIEKQVYSQQDLQTLTNHILNFIRECHSAGHDEELEQIRTEVNNGNLYFPDVFPKIINLVRQMIIELENFIAQNKKD
jgi:hypothetical protein